MTMCQIDEADDWTIFRSQERRAAKPHQCGDCGRTIDPGDRYHYATGLIYDHWMTMKQCSQCEASAWWLITVCGGFLYGYVLPELAEHWYEDDLYRSLGLGRVILTGRKRWMHNGELVPAETVKGWISDALSRVPARSR